jgi:NAD(P)-dependent dehydrogenase (short-subunit alcohol dehydrogenase family)
MKRKHSLIVGGTRGIGRAVARTLAAQGHVVSVIGRRKPAPGDAGLPRVAHWTVDLLDKKALQAALRKIIRQNGKLNNIVLCQRFRGEGDAWEGEVRTSLTATKNLIERLVDEFDAEGEKAIVVIASIACHWIAGEQGPGYHVAKAGLIQLARYYALTLGPRGIRVNCVSPGTTVNDENRDFYKQNRPLQNLYAGITPLRRMGKAEDVAGVVAFLCSEKAGFITGQNIILDGGASLQWPESLARGLAALDDLPVTRRSSGSRR